MGRKVIEEEGWSLLNAMWENDLMTSNNNIISLSQFHDCHVVGIVSPKDVLALVINDVQKNEVSKIELHGIQRVRINEFWEGNTILTMKLYEAGAIPSEALINVCLLDNENPNLKTFLDEEFNAIKDEVAAKNMKLLESMPSYGCDGYVLFSGELIVKPVRSDWYNF